MPPLRDCHRPPTERDTLSSMLMRCEHLLQQAHTLRKRQLMRYFALGFFDGGWVQDLTYMPQDARLSLVLGSSLAARGAWRRVHDECCRRGMSEARAVAEAERLIKRDDFCFRVDFVDVEALEAVTPLRSDGGRFAVFSCAELFDAMEPEMPPGTTWLEGGFRHHCSVRVAFRTARVVALRPQAVRPCLVGRWACPQLLRGRCVRKALLDRMSHWRQEMEAAQAR